MDAIVTAGGVPEPGEPLYEYTQGTHKAMLDVAGKPMIQWVLDALCEAQKIRQIVMIGLSEDSGLKCKKLGAFLPNQGSMLNNIRAGVGKILELQPDAEHVMIVSSDVPSIKPEMIDWIVDTCMQTDDDIYYNVITQDVMEKRFPLSKRSYTNLKDVAVCGGDINVIRSSLVTSEDEIWDHLIGARKNVLKQAAILGFDTLFLLLLRRITIDNAVKKVAKRLNVTGRAVICPYAEVGMDIDKPHQLELLRKDLAGVVKTS
ncbi:MAG: nucleotidyltransferase family protein [Anaerolineales bacterium]|nr:MAG: nucleotidyltransferase family protein [Anaerolineales bacterium]